MMREKSGLDRSTRYQLAEAYMAVQREYEDQGVIPSAHKTTLTRHYDFWVNLGAIHLGLLSASLSIILIFIVVNYLLHILPS